MELSAKLRAALAPANAMFTESDRRYFNDHRWEYASELAKEMRWPECQRLVAKIDKDFGRYSY